MRSGTLLRKYGVIALVFLVLGRLRTFWQEGLMTRLQENGFHEEPEGVSVVSQLGVEAAIGALGGLRYLVASGMEIEAIDHWEAHDWEQLHESYRLICLLQPHDPDIWRTAGWQMAYNASAWYLLDARHLPFEMRRAEADRYIERGIWFLEQGKQWNPDDYWLYRDLAYIYKEKIKDPCAAADEFLAGSRTADAPEFLLRFFAYEVAKCPGREREAYATLKPLYDRGYEALTEAKRQGAPPDIIEMGIRLYWKPSLITTLKEMEEVLGIPKDQRIPETWDAASFRINSPFRVENNSNDADE